MIYEHVVIKLKRLRIYCSLRVCMILAYCCVEVKIIEGRKDAARSVRRVSRESQTKEDRRWVESEERRVSEKKSQKKARPNTRMCRNVGGSRNTVFFFPSIRCLVAPAGGKVGWLKGRMRRSLAMCPVRHANLNTRCVLQPIPLEDILDWPDNKQY